MSKSVLKELWKAVKPPPAVKAREDSGPTEESLAAKRRQRRLLLGTATVLIVGAAAWEIYQYIASAPMRADEMYQQGMKLMGTSDYKGAEDRFTRAIGIWTSMPAAYYERGLARKYMNQSNGAMEDFEEAISQDPNLGPAHTELGTIFHQRGDITRAITEYSAAIQASPSADAYYQRGQLYESMGQHEKAIADYDASIHEEPDAPFVYQARAMARDAVGNHDEAEEDRLAAARLSHSNR
jgi:tetratricopeptide (TPR) repeat protein